MSLALSAMGFAEAAGQKYALVIGANKILALEGAQYGSFQLLGVPQDVTDMTLLLKCCGYHVNNSLVGPAATKTAIKNALASIASVAKPQDEVVFYFSGRGSVAAPNGQTRLVPGNKQKNEPTLVPYDGEVSSSDHDIRMSVIEDWAKPLVTSGCAVNVVLDCSFASWGGRSAQRHYRDVPRTIPFLTKAERPFRANGVRSPLFALANVAFVCACEPEGKAYEWRKSFGNSEWEGAFTDYFVELAIKELRSSHPSSMAQIVKGCRGYFRPMSDAGYMIGMGPSTSDGGARYNQPLFCQYKPAAPTADLKGEIARLDDARRMEEAKLRVGLELEDSIADLDKQATRSLASKQINALIDEQRMTGVKLIDQSAGVPDRILMVGKGSHGWQASVKGTAHEVYAGVSAEGSTMQDIFDGDVGNYLYVQAETKVIWSLLERPQPSLGFEAKTKPSYSPMKLGTELDPISRPDDQKLSVELKIPSDGFLYIMEQNDADRQTWLMFPDRGAEVDSTTNKVRPSSSIMVNRFSSDDTELPGKYRYGITDDNEVPRTTSIRFLFVADEPGKTNLPPLTQDELKPYARLARHLRALIAYMKSGQVRWQSVAGQYNVVSR